MMGLGVMILLVLAWLTMMLGRLGFIMSANELKEVGMGLSPGSDPRSLVSSLYLYYYIFVTFPILYNKHPNIYGNST